MVSFINAFFQISISLRLIQREIRTETNSRKAYKHIPTNLYKTQ